jgi:type II secretion system protein L
VYNTTNVSIQSTWSGSLTVKEELIEPLSMIEAFAQTLEKLPSINLLQGHFSVKQTQTQIKRTKKWLIYFSFAWVFLLFLYPSVSYFILKNRVSELDTQIAEIYKRNFPQSSSIVAPKTRMQEKLQKLKAGIGENRLLTLLGHVGKGLSTSSVTLKRFDFRNNELTLELVAGSSDDLSTFTDFLTRQGLTVKQQNANLTGTRINTMLVIE